MTPTLKGSALIITSAFFYASYGIWSRLMAGSFGEFNQAIPRSIALLIGIIIYAKITKSFKPIKKTDWKWFIIIGLMGLNQAPYYYGFKHLPIGTAILIFYFMLVASGFVWGKYLFGETITKSKQLALLLGVLGTGIIYKFSLSADQIMPAIGMAIAGFMGGTGGILPKKLSHNYSEPQIMTSYLWVIIVTSPILSMLFHETLPPLTDTIPWLSQLGYAISYLVANVSVIAGFKYLEASTGSIIGLVEILFGVLFGLLFFSEIPTLSTAIGGSLIVLAATLPHLKKSPVS